MTPAALPAQRNGAADRQRKRVMFVDDDQLLLDGLRDALHPYRHQWTMSFLTNGQDALSALHAEPPDVVVCDLRMPGLDGAALLEQVRAHCPSAVRIVLSGHAEIKMVARAAAAAHRLIAKPCETAELALVIERSCALQEIAARVRLDRRALGASSLPSVPRIYAELTDMLRSGSAGASDVAQIIEQDIAMAAKVLQLANSAYFGRRSAVTKVTDAVAYLGTDTLRALLLHAEAFRAFPIDPPIPGFDLDALHRHGARVAYLARLLLPRDAGSSSDALTAGLLHDVGLLALAAQDPDDLTETVAIAHQRNQPIHHVERERHGITHAEIGAHLLALWGLPHTVTEAVAGHHDKRWLTLPFDGVAAVHVATALVEEQEARTLRSAPPASGLDLEYLTHAGLIDHLPHWRELAGSHLA
jgi:HD-like signal output (HDOD) protein